MDPESLELDGEEEIGVDGIDIGLCGMLCTSLSLIGSEYLPFPGVVSKDKEGKLNDVRGMPAVFKWGGDSTFFEGTITSCNFGSTNGTGTVKEKMKKKMEMKVMRRRRKLKIERDRKLFI